jgi:AmmeMemoRadiSam system protein A
LIDLARRSIEHALDHGSPLPVELADFPRWMTRHRGVFVTLRRAGQLRGCVGNLAALEPLVVAVCRHAYNAGFRDPRFPPLRREDLSGLHVHISILSPTEAIEASSESELAAALRPGIDGVVLSDPPFHGTFLPSMWDRLATPEEFLAALKRKAGMAPGHWSDSLRAERYTATEVG